MPAIKGKMQDRGVIRRQAILDAAVELMSSKGFRGTPLASVAEAVGLTEAGVLHYFGSKEELLTAVLEERERTHTPEIMEWASVGGVESIRSLPNLARSIVAEPAFPRMYLVLQAEHLDDDSPTHDWFVKRGKAARKLFSMVLAKGVERGEFRDDFDIDMKAAEIVAFLDGIQVHWLLAPNQIDLVAAYESYTSSLERELSAGYLVSR